MSIDPDVTLMRLTESMARVEEAVKSCATKTDVELVRQELKLHIVEHSRWRMNWPTIISLAALSLAIATYFLK